MAKTATKKKYNYLTKALQLPDGTRKYIRAKTQAELDEKVLKAQILVNSVQFNQADLSWFIAI